MAKLTTKRWWTIKEVANELHYSYGWVLARVQNGEIHATRPTGRSYRIADEEVQRMLQPLTKRKQVQEPLPPVEIEVPTEMVGKLGAIAVNEDNNEKPEEELPLPTPPPSTPPMPPPPPEKRRRSPLGLDFKLF